MNIHMLCLVIKTALSNFAKITQLYSQHTKDDGAYSCCVSGAVYTVQVFASNETLLLWFNLPFT